MYMLFWRKKKNGFPASIIYLTCTPFSHLDVTQVYLGSISSTCLCTAFTLKNILKAQKAAWVSLFALLGYACIKAACKILLKLTPSQRWGRETLIIVGFMRLKPPPHKWIFCHGMVSKYKPCWTLFLWWKCKLKFDEYVEILYS